jgi:hypothetical protein
MAEGTVFSLDRTVLKSVDDEAGYWQYEGGNLIKEGKKVGIFMAVRRGFDPLLDPAFNASTYKLTLLFSGDSPPQNMTLQGAWDFMAGGCGSVSAISEGLAAANGAWFTVVGDKLTIQASWEDQTSQA